MSKFLSWIGIKALNGIIPGIFFMLTIASVSYALTSWSDPSAIRWRTSSDNLTSAGWNLLVGNVDNLNERLGNAEWSGGIVPPGAVMTFNLTTCPSGWSMANGTNGTPDLRGEFVRGWDGTGALARGVDSGRGLATSQNGTEINGIMSGSSGFSRSLIATNNEPSATIYTAGVDNTPAYTYSSYIANGTTSTHIKPRPRNVALLYCVKN